MKAAAVVRVLIEHVMLVVETAAAVVDVGGAAGGCSNLIASSGTGKDLEKSTGCKTNLQSISIDTFISLLYTCR